MTDPEAFMDTSETRPGASEGTDASLDVPLDTSLSKYEEAVTHTEKLNECLENNTVSQEAESDYAGLKKALKDAIERDDDAAIKEHVNLMAKMINFNENTIESRLIERPEQVKSLSPSSIGGSTENAQELIDKEVEDGDGQKEEGQPDKGRAQKRAISSQEIISATEIPNNDVTLKDIVGLEEAKKLLQEAILLPLRTPELLDGKTSTWNHVLFYGPPGTGKTKLATATANEANVPMFSISSTDILSASIRESEKMIRDLFLRAKYRKCVIFIDEVDSICRKRWREEADHTRRLKNQLLLEIGRNVSKQNVIICATNCPWDIDSAFMRRFQCRIYVPLPDQPARRQILVNKTFGVPMIMSQSDWDILADRTEGYSGSDLTNVANFAIQEPRNELISCEYWIQRSNDKKWSPTTADITGCIKAQLSDLTGDSVYVREVRLEDFLNALKLIQKSVPSSELDKYMTFMRSKQ